MTAEEFIEKLAGMAPNLNDLVKQGYSKEIAEYLIKRYFIKKISYKKEANDNSLLDLVNNYDLRNFRFSGEIKLGKRKHDFPSPPDKIHVGSIESDILVINPKSGQVELLDHENPDFVMDICAVSGEKFLDALLLLAGFEPPYMNLHLTKQITRKQKKANDKAAYKRARECARAAGLSKRHSIYEVLLGCGCWVL